MGAPSERAENLLAHAGWLRRLAYHLVRDPERAEDLVQDTWVAALRHPPHESDSAAVTRSFLGKMLRHALLHGARSERHRRAREHEHARSELDTGSAELVGEVESQRIVLEEVLKLPEPYRTTVLLRYFRELSAADIARAQDVPAATVRSRLKRALEQLRERLDARHGGDRSAWSLGLLAWAHQPVPPPSAPPMSSPLTLGTVLEGIIAMKATKIAALAGVTALTALGVSRLQRTPADAAPPAKPEIVAPSTPELRVGEPVQLAATQAEPSRTAVASAPASVAPAEPEPEVAAAELAPATVTALFVDDEGFPLPGVTLELTRFLNTSHEVPVAPALSASDGRAALALPVPVDGSFVVFGWRAEGHLLGSSEARLDVGRTTDLGTIALLRGSPVVGRVVDPEGRPVAGARVWALGAEIPDDEAGGGQIERRGPATVLGGFMERDDTPTVRAEADGSFRIPGVAVGAARVWAHAEGTKYCASLPFDVARGEEVQGIEVVLRPLDADDRIEGSVLTALGKPVPQASVEFAFHDGSLGMTSSLRAGDDGRFRLVLWRKVPHTLTVRGEDGAGNAHAASVLPGTLDLVLRLGDEQAFEVAVVDPDGRPVESFRLLTCIGKEGDWMGRFEAGTQHPGGRVRVGEPAESFWVDVSAVGFALGKLGPFEPGQVPAELLLELERAPSVNGHVYADGAAQAGARVCLYRAVTGSTRLTVNGFPAFWRQATLSDERTDAAGAFMLMPREEGEFIVRAELDGFAPAESAPLRLSPTTGANGLELHLGRGGTLVVQVTAPPGKDAAGVVVAVTRGDGHPRTLRADTEGRAVFEHMTPGRWNVLQTDEELRPFTTYSSSHQVTGEAEPERLWVVEVHEGRTARYALVLADEQD